MFRFSKKLISLTAAVASFAAFVFITTADANQFGATGLRTANPTPVGRSIVSQHVGRGSATGPSVTFVAPVQHSAPPVFDGTCMHPIDPMVDPLSCSIGLMTCLRMSHVCGRNFELCDTTNRFNQRAPLCHDILVTCPAHTVQAMFGITEPVARTERWDYCDGDGTLLEVNWTVGGTAYNLNQIIAMMSTTSEIATEIAQGMRFAATNAVQSCEAAVNACVILACSNEPHRCFNAAFTGMAADGVNNVDRLVQEQVDVRVSRRLVENFVNNVAWNQTDSLSYIQDACRIEVGRNEHCQTVAGQVATPGATRSAVMQEVRETITNEMVLTPLLPRFQGDFATWLATRAASTIENCRQATMQCVRNSCGGGSAALCFGRARDNNDIVDFARTPEIETQCAPMIAANPYCLDIAPSNATESQVWNMVWRDAEAVGGLAMRAEMETGLQSTFSGAGIARIRISCREMAENCVRRECGDDFSSCFIAGVGAGDRSAGQIIDGFVSGTSAGGFSVETAMGLCMLQVNRNQQCRDYFDMSFARNENFTQDDPWGQTHSLRNAWDSMATVATAPRCAADRVHNTQQCINARLAEHNRSTANRGRRDRQPNIESIRTACAGENPECATIEFNVFSSLIQDIAQEAQANMTRRAIENRNICEERGRAFDGAMIANLAPNFMWSAIPAGAFDSDSWLVDGFRMADVERTTDIFGGMCVGRVEMQVMPGADGRTSIQEVLSSRALNIRYFPVGSSFTCGSWVSATDIQEIDRAVIAAAGEANLGFLQQRPWLAGTMGALGGIVGGGFAGAGIQQAITGNRGTQNNNQVQLTSEERVAINTATTNRDMCQQCASRQANCTLDMTGAIHTCLILTAGTVDNSVAAGLAAAAWQREIDRVNTDARQRAGTGGGQQNQQGLLGRNTTGMYIGAGVLGVTGAVAATAGARQSRDNAIQNHSDEAVRTWWQDVGSRINCVIDGRVVGSFGDPIVVQ